MDVASFTVADHAGFDLARGAAAVIGAVLFIGCMVVLVLLRRRPDVVPSWWLLAVAGWMIGDAYVAAREAFEIGRPVYIFGLPLAVAWELLALASLRRLWHSTDRLRRRPHW